MEKIFMRVSEFMEVLDVSDFLCLQIDLKTQQRVGKVKVCYDAR